MKILDEEGKMVSMNNCSDMYLIVGSEKALLIDLSNAIERDNASESLRTLIYDRIGKIPLYISGTHQHGDHTGMLPTFKGDPQAHFWVIVKTLTLK